MAAIDTDALVRREVAALLQLADADEAKAAECEGRTPYRAEWLRARARGRRDLANDREYIEAVCRPARGLAD